MIRHVLAPVLAPAAASLSLPRTLGLAASVTLTFDDGPHPEGTPAVLKLLERAEARAIFFMVGEQVAKHPALAAEVAAAGHVVALHGYRHRLQLRLGQAAVEEDLRHGREVIAQATGAEPVLHRPPYGIYSPTGLAATGRLAMRPLLWSRWGKDWRRFTTPSRIAARVTRRLAAGDVILLHDADSYSARNSHRRTVEALKLIFAELEQRSLSTSVAL